MKKVTLTLTILSLATLSIAQQAKPIPAKIDTTGPDKIPGGARLEDLISKLPILAEDTNTKKIRIDCKDIVLIAKDTARRKPAQTPTLDELLKKMGRIEVDKDGVVRQNGKIVKKINVKNELLLDTVEMKNKPVAEPVTKKKTPDPY